MGDLLCACARNTAGLTQRGLPRLADELDLADFVELINGDKEAPTRPVSHDMLVQETLLRLIFRLLHETLHLLGPA